MTTSARTFTIGTLSERSGCSVDTIRYYERLRLIPGVTRTEGGHRLYNAEHSRRLGFIRRSRDLGLSLAQVRALLHQVDRKALDCGKARPVLEAQLATVRRRIAEFRALEHDLQAMVEVCRGAAKPSCRIDEPGCRVIESWQAEGKSTVQSCRPTGIKRGAAGSHPRARSA